MNQLIISDYGAYPGKHSERVRLRYQSTDKSYLKDTSRCRVHLLSVQTPFVERDHLGLRLLARMPTDSLLAFLESSHRSLCIPHKMLRHLQRQSRFRFRGDPVHLRIA